MEHLMEHTVYTIDDKVDYFLNKIANSPTLTLHACALYEVEYLDEDTYLIDQVMIEKGLIKAEHQKRIITGKGLEVSNFGGWTMYQKLMKRERPDSLVEQTRLKYQREIAELRKKLGEVENELENKKEREITAYLIIRNLIRQNKHSKLLYLLSGAVSGAIITGLIWALFA